MRPEPSTVYSYSIDAYIYLPNIDAIYKNE